MKANVIAAAPRLESHPAQTAANLDAIRRQTLAAARRGAELVVFPELSITGFLPNHPLGDHAQWLHQALHGAWHMAEPLDGPAVRALAEISREAGVFVAAGMLENAGALLHNTYVLAGEGRLYGHWRKMHVPLFEMQLYNGGDAPHVVDTPLGRIGANICFDALFPESTRLLAIQGCEIALMPFAADPPSGTAAAWANWARPVVQARCLENTLFAVASNYAGNVAFAGATQAFPGGAIAIGPNGSVIAEESDGMLFVDLTAAQLIEARAAFEYTFRMRRPELYARLSTP